MQPFDSIKQVWRDPKKRPWLIAGAGAAAGAGVLAMRRPGDPDEQASEDAAADEAAPPSTINDPFATDASGLAPVIAVPGASGGFGVIGAPYDPGMSEMDLSGVWDEIGRIEDAQASALGEAVATERAARNKQIRTTRTQVQRTQQRVQQQKKVNQRQRRQIARLNQRLKNQQRKLRARAPQKKKKKQQPRRRARARR